MEHMHTVEDDRIAALEKRVEALEVQVQEPLKETTATCKLDGQIVLEVLFETSSVDVVISEIRHKFESLKNELTLKL